MRRSDDVGLDPLVLSCQEKSKTRRSQKDGKKAWDDMLCGDCCWIKIVGFPAGMEKPLVSLSAAAMDVEQIINLISRRFFYDSSLHSRREPLMGLPKLDWVGRAGQADMGKGRPPCAAGPLCRP